jgi:lamin tail-like protein
MNRSLRTTLIATGAAAVLGVVGLVALPADAATLPQMQLSYIVYDSPGKDTRSNASLIAEYVRITNNGAANNLKNWTLVDAAGHKFTFPNHPIGKGAKVWVKTGKGTNNSSTVFWGSGNYIWNNDKDTATLRSASGRLYDTCKWTRPGSGHTSC